MLNASDINHSLSTVGGRRRERSEVPPACGEAEEAMALLVSAAFIVATLVVCDALRSLVSSKERRSRTGTRPLLAATVATDVLVSVELCTASLELGVVFEGVGFGARLCGLYLNCLYQGFRWRRFTQPSPIAHVFDFMSGGQSLALAAARSAVVLAAGLATYRFYVLPVWSWEASRLHVGRSWAATSAGRCRVPSWGAAPVLHAFLAEFAGSLVLAVAPRLAAEHPAMPPAAAVAAAGALVVATVCAAMEMSGGFFSPVLASVMVGGCDGHSLWHHVLIYWVGATAGAVVGFKAYPRVKAWAYAGAGPASREEKMKKETDDRRTKSD